MLKYIHAELYKVCHRRAYTGGSLAFVLGGEILLLLLLKFGTGDADNSFDVVASMLMLVLSVGIYLVLMLCDMVFSDQYKVNTLKNEVSYGVSRGCIYLGKLISSIVTALVFCGVVLAVYLLLGLAMFRVETPLGELLPVVGQVLAAALPLWLGGLGFYHMLLFVSKGSTVATVIYVLVMGVVDSGLKLIALFSPWFTDAYLAIRAWLPAVPFETLPTDVAADPGAAILHAWLVGLVWFAASTLIGCGVFQKREIK